MPRHSVDTIIQRAIGSAILDRLSFIEACGEQSPEGISALALIEQLKSLINVKRREFTSDQSDIARQALIFAEQEESGFYASDPKSQYGAAALKQVQQYRELRLRLWGKTQFEHMMETAPSIPLFDLKRHLESSHPDSAGSPYRLALHPMAEAAVKCPGDSRHDNNHTDEN